MRRHLDEIAPSPSMPPRSACGGCAPSPRKLKPAVSRIIQPTVVESLMTIAGSTLGKSSVATIWRSLKPESRAAAMKSARTTASVAPRTARAKKGILTMMIATIALKSPGPSAATMASASRR